MSCVLPGNDHFASPSAAVLHGVAAGRAGVAVWERALGDALQRSAEVLRMGPAYRQRVAVDPCNAGAAIATALDGLAAPDDVRRCMAKELSQLLRLALSLASGAPMTLRFERIDDDGCRLFHVDRVHARMICTYVGAGTEWLPEAAVDRSKMGLGSNAHVRDFSLLRTVPTGAVALLRGDLHPSGPGVLHRSPPIGESLPRLLTAIDW